MKIITEFKEFAVKGNMIDLAVGIIIGAAFGKIIASLVSDVIMPPIGLLLGGMNFTDIQIIMKDAVKDPVTGKVTAAVALKIGSFFQTLVDFTIIAFSVFMMIKGIISLKEKENRRATCYLRLQRKIRNCYRRSGIFLKTSR